MEALSRLPLGLTDSVEDQDEWLSDKRVAMHGNKDMVPTRGPQLGMTQVVPRLKTDLEAIIMLMFSNTPTKRVIWRQDLVTAYYGFGDASLDSFGSLLGLSQGVCRCQRQIFKL